MIFLKYGTIIDKIKAKIRGTIDMDRLVKDGLVVGSDFHVQEGVIIDPGHCWLIEIGDNVTLAPRVHILAHDASTKNLIGYTKIAKVIIGNNVFVGAGTIILPGVKITNNVVIGAGSVVAKDCLKEGVYVGNPAKYLFSIKEYKEKNRIKMSKSRVFDSSYVIHQITEEKKEEMKKSIIEKTGYII